MTAESNPSLRRAAEKLRVAQARALGALDSAQRVAAEARNAGFAAARSELERELVGVRHRASEAAKDHRLSVRDSLTLLQPDETAGLDVAEFITIGKLSAHGTPPGEGTDLPLVVPLIGRGHVIVEAHPDSARRLVERIVGEALRGTAPGQLDVIAYDPMLTSALSPFSELRSVSEDSVQVISRAAELERTVQRLFADVRRVKDAVRSEARLGASGSLVDFHRAVGRPVERYHLVVLLDYPAEVDDALHRQVLALASAGADAGVNFVFVMSPDDDRKSEWWHDEDVFALGSVLREERGAFRWDAHPELQATIPDDDPALLARSMHEWVSRARSAAAPRVPFDAVQPLDSPWQSSSADRLQFAIGLGGASTTEITLGDESDQRHNILITGAVGQGKSNLLKVLIHSLAQRYSPEELELYLLDFKEGVTLYPMAPTPDAPDFLPQARVLGLESDRDFGLSVLRHIETEFARRAKLFRPHGENISRYRAAVPEAVMPRIVLVVDEFQMLFDPHDATAEAAAELLEAIARRGRSYGVHLVLASQTISGIAALMMREGGIFAQFPIRLALKNAMQESFATLGQGNDAAARLRARGDAILNLDYGHIDSNRRVTIAAADDAELARLRHGWWDSARSRVPLPRVFDGSTPARLAGAIPDLHRMRVRAAARPGSASALLGYPIDVSGIPLSLSFTAEPGRNLALLGAGEATSRAPLGEDSTVAGAEHEGPRNNAIGVLQAAAVSLAVQHPAGDAEFVSLDMLDEETLRRNNHRTWLDVMAGVGHPVQRIGRDDIAGYLQALADGLESRGADAPPRYLIGFGLDRAPLLDAPDMFARQPSEDLQRVLRSGPPQRVHLLGWWANAATFRSHIGFGGEGFIDAMLMLRIDQGSVQELLSSPFVTWSVRDNRGMLSDRTQLTEATTIIPFSPLTDHDAAVFAATEWEG